MVFTAVDQHGIVLFRYPEPDRWIGQRFSNEFIMEAINSQDRGTIEGQGVDGVSRLYAFSPLSNISMNTHVLIGVPYDIAFAETNRILFQNIIGLGVVAIIALLAVWVGGDILVLRQVRSLIGTTIRLKAGDLSARAEDVRGTKELDELARAFNAMAVTLEQRNAEIEASRANLLRQIQETEEVTKALRESERRFQAIFHNAFQLTGLLAPDGVVLEANQTMLSTLRRSRKEVVGKRFWDLPLWDTSEEATSLLKVAIAEAAGGKFIRYETEIRDADDKLRTIDFSLKPIKDDDGRVVTIIPEGRDISERKEAEEALSRSEKMYRTLTQNLPNTGVFLFDRDLRYLLVEGPLLETFGLPRQAVREQLEGHFVTEVFPPDVTQWLLPYYQAALAGTGSVFEYYFENRTILIQVLPVRNEDDAIFAGLAVVLDITARKEAEKVLQQSEERLRTVVENMPVMMVALDKDRNITAWNRECEKVTGYTAEEMIGKMNVLDLLPDTSSRKRVTDEWDKRGTDYHNWEWRVRSKNDTVKTISWFNISGQFPIAGWDMWCIGVDVTERVDAERLLREAHDKLEARVRERTADLKQANDELSSFTYIVSHDLRAPLINLKGFAAELRAGVGIINSHLQQGLTGPGAAQQSDLLQAIQSDIPEALDFIDSSVARMDQLTTAVLKLSRLGRRELYPELLNMETVVETILSSLAHQIRERQASVTIGPLPQVTADRMAMEQIMGNLLSNAVTYLRPGCPGEIEVTGEEAGEEVVFHIRDNGRGIAEEDRHKVFEPFRRAGRQDTPGEGMGLAFVQALVRRHGGHIWYESKVGEGTTFSFTVPKQLAKQSTRDNPDG
jgi:PAS domain S-box-containing protein